MGKVKVMRKAKEEVMEKPGWRGGAKKT